MRLPDLIPCRTFSIATSWSPEVAAAELKKAIDQGSPLFGGAGVAPFVGECHGPREFTFRRRSDKKASPAIVRVVVEPSHHDGACLRVTVRLPFAPMVSLTALSLFSLVIAFSGGLGVVALPLFGAGAVGVSFASEARKAEKLLRLIYVHAPALPEPPETGQAYR